MSRLVRSALAFLSLLVALAIVPASGSAAETYQWSFTPTNTIDQLRIDTPYSVTNSTGGFFGVGAGGLGIDLRFGPSGGGQFRFERQNHRDHRVVKASESVALYSTKKGQYLTYGPQAHGVDLRWSVTPRYEWQALVGQDSLGQVRTELFDTRAGSYLVYKPQLWATNLGFQRGVSPAAAF